VAAELCEVSPFLTHTNIREK